MCCLENGEIKLNYLVVCPLDWRNYSFPLLIYVLLDKHFNHWAVSYRCSMTFCQIWKGFLLFSLFEVPSFRCTNVAYFFKTFF